MTAVTLTLNPCVDRTLWVEKFGQPPTRIDAQSGGKGLNVARVLNRLGTDCLAVYPLGGKRGQWLNSLTEAEGIRSLPVEVSAETRLIDTEARISDMEQRVAYQKGEALSESELDALENALFEALEGARVLAISGSASSAEAAKRVLGIIQRAKSMGVSVLLDSNGEALLDGAKAAPDILKPNQSELAALVGRTIEPGAEAGAAEELLKLGIGGVLVSLGSTGCVYVRRDGQYFCPAPRVTTVNPVGSGDSFVAGFLWAVLNGWPDSSTALRIACAAGAANAAMFPAAQIGWPEIEAILGTSFVHGGR